jgi:1,4-alpha-glucan branching enzyme
LIFSYHNDTARTVQLAGDFNQWKHAINFEKEKDGIWRLQLVVPAAGKYRYKFIVDGNQWVEDPGNGMKELDEYGGFNSILSCS